MKPNHLVYDSVQTNINQNNQTTLYHPFSLSTNLINRNKSATIGDILKINSDKTTNDDDSNSGMVSIDDDDETSSSPLPLSSLSDFDRFIIDNGSGADPGVNSQLDSAIEHQLVINSSSISSDWNDWISNSAGVTLMMDAETTTLPPSSLSSVTPTFLPNSKTILKITTTPMNSSIMTASSTETPQIVSSSLKKQLLISNTYHHLSKHNSSLSKSSNWLAMKPNAINIDSSMQSSDKSTNHLTTIATIANSISAAFLPTQLQSQTVNRTISSQPGSIAAGSIDYVVDTPPHSLPGFPTSSGTNGSGEDDDYFTDWSTTQDYQFLINLSIGGIIITTFVLLLFLLWLCCSKNDRDQYSIRKVPGNNHHRHHRSSINTSSSDSINTGISVNVCNNDVLSKRRSNCSLYISNPNSEDSQPDIPGGTLSNNNNNNGSIIFQNQLADHQHHANSHHHHHHNYTNKPITTIIRKYDVECGNDGDGNSNDSGHSFDAIFDSEKFKAISVDLHDQKQRRRSNGLQLARNLAAYCENQHLQSTKDSKRMSNTGDLKMINKIDPSSTNTTMTIYDYYDNNTDHQMIGRSRTLPWPTNGNSTSADEPEAISTPKLSDDNKHTSISSLFTRTPIDGQVNFTKKRRNRMHNDSAAAIAMNRSGLLQLISHDTKDTGDNSNQRNRMMLMAKASPDALLTYYEKMTQMNSTCCDTNTENCTRKNNDQQAIDSTLSNQKRIHQNSPETSSGDSIILTGGNNTMTGLSSTTSSSPPIVVYNQRTVL